MTHAFIVANLNQCRLQKKTIRVFVTRSIDRSLSNTVMQSHIAVLFLSFCVLRKNTAKSYSKFALILRTRHLKYFGLTGRNGQVPSYLSDWRPTLNHFLKHCLPFCTVLWVGEGRDGKLGDKRGPKCKYI